MGSAVRAMVAGAEAAGATVRACPVADGGDGTLDALIEARGGRRRYTTVPGPLGEPVRAAWGDLGDGQAVVEMAAASGLALVPPGRRDARRATSYGTGALVGAALDAGSTDILLGVGGSASTDGGAGLWQALGARLLDKSGRDLPWGGAALRQLNSIDIAGLDPRLKRARLRVATDVNNPLLGPRGAAAVFGPQKGADAQAVRELDEALAVWARRLEEATGRAVGGQPGAGAGGGVGAGALALGGQVWPGGPLVLEWVEFDKVLAGADLCLTGEGRLDAQSAAGKTPLAVAQSCRALGVPCVALAAIYISAAGEAQPEWLDGLMLIQDGPMSAALSRRETARLLQTATERAVRLFAAGLQRRSGG